MQSAYVEYKDFENCRHCFLIPFGSHRLRFFVWEDVKALRRNTFFRQNDQIGAYVPYPYRKKRIGVFGEVHLVTTYIGVGYVAHEIQHALYDWMMNHKQTSRTNESLALLAGEVTRKFWKRYYRSCG